MWGPYCLSTTANTAGLSFQSSRSTILLIQSAYSLASLHGDPFRLKQYLVDQKSGKYAQGLCMQVGLSTSVVSIRTTFLSSVNHLHLSFSRDSNTLPTVLSSRLKSAWPLVGSIAHE